MKYLIVIEKAGTGYSAYSPEIPGCVATGSTRDEAESEMTSAVAFHIEGLKSEGMALPTPHSSSSYVEVCLTTDSARRTNESTDSFAPQLPHFTPSATKARRQRYVRHPVACLPDLHGLAAHTREDDPVSSAHLERLFKAE
jgi:predicted RNase H-like HicB family nuclease